MEKFMYPMPYMRITQGYMYGTHASSYAIDDAGSDDGKDYVIAPYSGTVKLIYPQFENEVFFESDDKVEFANGVIDYATTMFVHQDSPMQYGMKAGKHYNQGEKIYLEGGRYKGKNGYFANHLHVEFGRGKCDGWYENASGYYSLKNAMKPEDCCFIDETYHILESFGYGFKNTKKDIGYQAHIQGIGWQDWKYDGQTAGTTHESRRLEAIKIDYEGDIYAKAHIQDKGWVDYDKINKDTIIGTTGESKRLECLCLKGNFKYRVHIECSGWSCWTKADGVATLGSIGQSLRIEAIEIKVLK